MSLFYSAGLGGSAIPDSVVTRWPMDEGSGSTVADSEGSDDLTFEDSPTWVNNSDYIGGYYLDFDGTNDVLVPSGSVPPVPSGDYSIPVTLRLDNDITSIRTPYRWENSGQSAAMGFVAGVNGTNDLLFRAVNDNGTSFDAQTTLSQGDNRVVGVLDTDNSELKMGLNGSFVDTVAVSGSFTSPPDDQFAIGRRPGPTERFWPEGIDEPMIDTSAWGSTKLSDDYNRQPWS